MLIGGGRDRLIFSEAKADYTTQSDVVRQMFILRQVQDSMTSELESNLIFITGEHQASIQMPDNKTASQWMQYIAIKHPIIGDAAERGIS